jgi:hypothetical protein
MLGWIREKMAIQESTPRSGRFSASSLIGPCVASEDCSIVARTIFGITHIHPTHPASVRGWAESLVLWCNTHNVRVGAQMAELAVLQLVQLVGIRFTTKGPTSQKARAPPPPGFRHTMSSVKRVKDNMWLAVMEKMFTNHAIRTNVQTRYLHFKGMSYKSESYLCDINCVQLRKTLARF